MLNAEGTAVANKLELRGGSRCEARGHPEAQGGGAEVPVVLCKAHTERFDFAKKDFEETDPRHASHTPEKPETSLEALLRIAAVQPAPQQRGRLLDEAELGAMMRDGVQATRGRSGATARTASACASPGPSWRVPS